MDCKMFYKCGRRGFMSLTLQLFLKGFFSQLKNSRKILVTILPALTSYNRVFSAPAFPFKKPLRNYVLAGLNAALVSSSSWSCSVVLEQSGLTSKRNLFCTFPPSYM